MAHRAGSTPLQKKPKKFPDISRPKIVGQQAGEGEGTVRAGGRKLSPVCDLAPVLARESTPGKELWGPKT